MKPLTKDAVISLLKGLGKHKYGPDIDCDYHNDLKKRQSLYSAILV
jgi:hypothetical protein